MIVRDFVVFCSFSVDNSYFKNKFKRNFKIYMCQLVMNSKDTTLFLTIIPRARMGYESIAIDSEAMRAIGIIVLVKSN